MAHSHAARAPRAETSRLLVPSFRFAFAKLLSLYLAWVVIYTEWTYYNKFLLSQTQTRKVLRQLLPNNLPGPALSQPRR